jgi:hypothetical protein
VLDCGKECDPPFNLARGWLWLYFEVLPDLAGEIPRNHSRKSVVIPGNSGFVGRENPGGKPISSDMNSPRESANSESFYNFFQSIFRQFGFTLGFRAQTNKAQLFCYRRR